MWHFSNGQRKDYFINDVGTTTKTLGKNIFLFLFLNICQNLKENTDKYLSNSRKNFLSIKAIKETIKENIDRAG